ncbi:triose-phosphate isomerase [Candidatus Venteria ishoeyi]|uniref:Triosephosphate isomerase n=1 Tax=Candidatus Venteria ishoeyi TaxID=1899563 RepID=A0A1H6FH28_9GAMM|nr:triose-phosphate isomerase [Candidatus Venteria ishoeyi]MDM8547388.1 triose-phosphate isomerase [Candidatus Venteria ishoeyi]SEH08741.1 Triosephosphate isomerase [Candidatus Venteria ishoeyi]
MRQILVAGNWKMNGSTASIASLLDGIKAGMDKVQGNVSVAVCPPFVYLQQVASALEGSKIAWGGQNVSSEASGAFTGEIALDMLKDFACHYVIIGHSERRSLYGESDEIVADKYAVVRAGGLKPILCVGELLEEREAGQTEAVVAKQLDAVLARNGVEALADGVIAYEPVWAIGTGKTASPEQAQEVHAFIRAKIAKQSQEVADKVQILYGGSMKPGNAADLLAKPDIDGGLIGGAALKAEDFLGICTAA